MRGLRLDRGGDVLGERDAVDRQRRARRDCGGIRGAHHQRTAATHLFLQQPDCIGELRGSQRVAAHEFREVAALVGRRGHARAHLVEAHVDSRDARPATPPRNRPGRRRRRPAALRNRELGIAWRAHHNASGLRRTRSSPSRSSATRPSSSSGSSCCASACGESASRAASSSRVAGSWRSEATTVRWSVCRADSESAACARRPRSALAWRPRADALRSPLARCALRRRDGGSACKVVCSGRCFGVVLDRCGSGFQSCPFDGARGTDAQCGEYVADVENGPGTRAKQLVRALAGGCAHGARYGEDVATLVGSVAAP